MPLGTWVGYVPVASVFSGTIRVIEAAKIVFKELSQSKTAEEKARKSELWNAFKNIFRGIIEIIPLTGIALILFDATRGAIYINRINKELKERENIVGIAIDGKIILTIDFATFDRNLTNPSSDSKHRLDVFQDLCLQCLKKADERKCKLGMDELFPRLGERIRTRSTE